MKFKELECNFKKLTFCIIYDFPASPLQLIGALGISIGRRVFFHITYKKYLNSSLNKVVQQKNKTLLQEKEALFTRIEEIEQDLKIHLNEKKVIKSF